MIPKGINKFLRGDPGDPKIYHKILTYVFHVFGIFVTIALQWNYFLYILSIREGLKKSVFFSEHCQISSTLPILCLNWNKWIWRFLCFCNHTKLIDFHYSLSKIITFLTCSQTASLIMELFEVEGFTKIDYFETSFISRISWCWVHWIFFKFNFSWNISVNLVWQSKSTHN